MGLAAAQARLLSITRRMSDNELRAQLINNQKMRLTSESSRVSENYIAALNSTNLMFTNYGINDARQTVPLTYNELTAFNQYNNQYVLSDVAGSIFLREDEANLYAQANGDLETYLNLHGIQFTTTYWDTIGNVLPDDELPAAAVIRAWYESAGIDASAGVNGLEGCSIFPMLNDIAERINLAVEDYRVDNTARNALISRAAETMLGNSDFNHWFGNPPDWLSVGNDANDSFWQLSNHWDGENSFLNRYFQVPYNNSTTLTELDEESRKLHFGDNYSYNSGDGGFQDIYTALWNYGNNQPLGVELSTLPTKWQNRLGSYQPTESLTIDQFFDGCAGAPTNYGTGANGMYEELGYTEFGPHDEEIFVQTGEKIKIPGENDTVSTVLLWNNDGYGHPQYEPGFSSVRLNVNGLNYDYVKYVDGDDVYYIPHQNYSILPIYKGSSSSLTPAQQKSQATAWIQEALEDHIIAELKIGERIQTEEQKLNFLDMDFSAYEIDVINNRVTDGYGLSELTKEFFNVLLGTSYEGKLYNANGDNGIYTLNNCNRANYWQDVYIGNTSTTGTDNYNDNHGFVYRDIWHATQLCETINTIMEGLNSLQYDSLQSRTLDNSDIDSLRNIFINGFAEYGYTAEQILDEVWANITTNNGVIYNEDGWDNGNLRVQFKNYTDTTSNYGYYDYGRIKDFNNDLLLEFVYPAAIDFFNRHGMPVYGYMRQNGAGEWEDATAEAEWYTNLFNKVQQNGYKTLERGLASSTDWIRFALENGVAIIEQLNTVDTWNKITYNSCSDITEETDSMRATLAEAEYNKAMNQIQAKDERLDLELKNIDTEHSALQKEYESVQKAMNDNVTRTFKMYS